MHGIQEDRRGGRTRGPAGVAIAGSCGASVPQAGSDAGVIGGSSLRTDSAGKVTGATRYVEDMRLAGMLHGAVVRSPHHHARVLSIDLSEARGSSRRRGSADRCATFPARTASGITARKNRCWRRWGRRSEWWVRRLRSSWPRRSEAARAGAAAVTGRVRGPATHLRRRSRADPGRTAYRRPR